MGDIDFETKLWEISAKVMKMKRSHIVPISAQVIDLLKQLDPISKHHTLVFIGRNNSHKPISKESISQVIELLGYNGRLVEEHAEDLALLVKKIRPRALLCR